MFLRNEACAGGRLGFEAVFLEAKQSVQGFVEGPFVRGGITDKEREALFVHAFGGKALVLKTKCTLQQPMRLHHAIHEQLFRGIGGSMIAAESVAQDFRSQLDFHRE